MATDLAALLTGARVPGPYLLVGHSFGGLIVRLYAAYHLEDVAGMVLIDSTHPDEIARAAAILPPPGERTEALRQFLDWAMISDPATHPEGIAFEASLRQVREASVAGGLGNAPLAVLSRGTSYRCDFPALPPDLAAKVDAAWLEAQREFAQLSSNSVHRIATRSGHNIPGDEPELVVETVRDVVDRVRAALA
jgi:pimeloyl-ACP methyl ester carboxylesterase